MRLAWCRGRRRGKVAVGKGVHVGSGEEGHFDADEGVRETERDVFAVGVGSESCDGADCDKEGDGNGLPKGKEEDAFDTKEFWDGTVGA